MKNTLVSSFRALAGLSPREIAAWASLLVTTLIYGPYFLSIWRAFADDALTPGAVLGAFIGVVISQVVLLVAIHIIAAIVLKDEPKDERDIAIENRSSRFAYNVLSGSIVVAAIGLVITAAAKDAPPVARYLGPVFLSQVFLFCFILAEVVQYLSQAISYRRGR